MTADSLQERYAVALRSCVKGAGEPALEEAYEIGRTAIAEGCTLADVVTLHQEAELAIFFGSATGPDRGSLMSAETFLAECLAPYEMAQRGYQEMIETLRALNCELAKAKEEAERQSGFKSTLLANMSHELRTPLNAILGISELLIDEIIGPLEETQKKFVGTLMSSGRHLLALVNDLLDMSSIEAGKFVLAFEYIDPDELVGPVLEAVQELADRRHILLTSDTYPSLPDVYVDPTRIRQILFNLLANAIKFTPEGGHVCLEIPPTRNGTFVLLVKDSGVGIAQEDLPKLFREFERLDPPPGARVEGTGLGLALTKKLVELHGGSVRVSSALGTGSTFTVAIPLDPIMRTAINPVAARTA